LQLKLTVLSKLIKAFHDVSKPENVEGKQMVIFHNFKAHALAIQKLLRLEGLRTVLLNAEQS
jgi:hypothetical protein